MVINYIEIVNLIIAFILIVALLYVRGAIPMILALFIYGTLHFSFGVLVLFGPDSFNTLNRLHTEGGGFFAQISLLSVLCVVFTLLAKDAYQIYLRSDSNESENKIVISFLVTMLTIFIGYLINLRVGDWTQLKNIISIEGCLTLMLLTFLTLKKFELFDKIKVLSVGSSLLLMFFIIDCLAFYEVFSASGWFSYVDRHGAPIFRASAVLFNPNLLGLWSALIYIACAFAMYFYPKYRMMTLMGMTLAAVAIYLSGSRSMMLPLLGSLLISSVLIKEKFRWTPLLLLLTIWVFIYLISAWLASIVPTNNSGWWMLKQLGERLFSTPIDLINYLLRTEWLVSIMENDWGISKILNNVNERISEMPGVVVEGEVWKGIDVSIAGRLKEEGDSGWLVIYRESGLLGLFGMVLASGIMVVWSIRAYVASKSIQSVYAFVILVFCLFSGLVIQFQLFPIWIFVALAIFPCFVFLQKVKIKSRCISPIKTK